MDALVDGEPVDWQHLESMYPNSASLLAQLRAIQKVVGSRQPKRQIGKPNSVWTRQVRPLVLMCAGVQVIAGALGYVAGFARPSAVPAGAYFVALVVFGAVSIWLFVGARRDPRAGALGGFLLLIAAAFAPRFIGVGTPTGALFRGLYPEAFLGAFLWGFVRQFPRTVHYSRADVFCAAAERLSYVAGMILFVVSFLHAYNVPFIPHVVARSDPQGAVGYWTVIFALLAAAPVALIFRGRHASQTERQRLAVFSLGFGVVLLLIAAEILAELALPAFRSYAIAHRAEATPYFFALLLTLPITTAYAVLVDNAFDVRVTIGRVARYLLARHVTAVFTILPLLFLAGYLYSHRHQTIIELSSGWQGIAAGLLFVLGFVVAVAREPALAFVDRHFDRQSVDLSAEAAALTALLTNARSVVEVGDLLERNLQRVLAVQSVVTYSIDPSALTYLPVNRIGVPLSSRCALVAIVTATRSLLVIDERATPLLPLEDLGWCDRSGSEALVPIRFAASQVTELVAIGRKLSGDRLSRGERTLLETVASAASLRLDALRSPALTTADPDDEEPAAECVSCWQVLKSRQTACDCGGATRPAAVPRQLFGKFRIVSYVGSGGMGVVYRGIDTGLDRPVALKTLGRLSAAAADRLASEARMMASVAHPNLATIFGIEQWRHTPVLVLEFFDGGTLNGRLHVPWTISEVLRLGSLLTPALEQLHQTGVLHRDIKPSNIGFTKHDVPKLLDFGIASFLSEEPGIDIEYGNDTTASVSATQTVTLRGCRPIAGTPLYLAPELLDGAEPSPAGDLWALALVLFESIAGQHPFAANTVQEVLYNIAQFDVLDLRRWRPDCPPQVAHAFSRMLARDSRERPGSAAMMRTTLARLL